MKDAVIAFIGYAALLVAFPVGVIGFYWWCWEVLKWFFPVVAL